MGRVYAYEVLRLLRPLDLAFTYLVPLRRRDLAHARTVPGQSSAKRAATAKDCQPSRVLPSKGFIEGALVRTLRGGSFLPRGEPSERAAVRQKLHLSSCADFRLALSLPRRPLPPQSRVWSSVSCPDVACERCPRDAQRALPPQPQAPRWIGAAERNAICCAEPAAG